MKVEIHLAKPSEHGETSYLKFDDYGATLPTQWEISIVTYDKDGKVEMVKPIGVVNKSEVVRLAKAT